MTIRRYAEVVCDRCGCAEHYLIGGSRIEEKLKDDGWKISRGKHYCCNQGEDLKDEN